MLNDELNRVLTCRIAWRLEELNQGLRLLKWSNCPKATQLQGALVSAYVADWTVAGLLCLLEAEAATGHARLRHVTTCHGVLELLRGEHVLMEHYRRRALVRRLLVLGCVECLVHIDENNEIN